jgi:selenocysteine lyase/cysteine desulfurase
LIEAGAALGLTLASPRRAEDRGGSIMFRLPDNVDPVAVVDAARRQSVFADTRGRVLRLSPGNVTTIDGVQRLVSALQAVLCTS